jgi:predicted nucleic acid-binding protein
MTIVDTTVWIDYFRGTSTAQAQWLDAHLTVHRIGLLDIMVCELLQGVGSNRAASTMLRHLRRCAIHDSGGLELAVATAANYRTLRAQGVTVRKTIDCLIATWCIREGHTLLHNDRDFDPFEQHLGLRVVAV